MKKINKTITAGGIIVNEYKEVVIVNQNHDSWSLPKGHVEDNETFLETAKREIYEETGLSNIELIKELGSYERYRISLDGNDDINELKVIHMFLFRAKKQKLIPIDPNNPEARWIKPKYVSSYLTHQKDKDFFNNQLLIGFQI